MVENVGEEVIVGLEKQQIVVWSKEGVIADRYRRIRPQIQYRFSSSSPIVLHRLHFRSRFRSIEVERKEDAAAMEEEEEEEKTRKVRKEGFFLCRRTCQPLNLYYMEVKDVKSSLFAEGRTELQIEGNPFVKKLVSNDDSCFNVVGSCNHLICFSARWDEDPIYILNPFENRYLSIDSPGSRSDEVGKQGYVSGFGYDVRTGNYKILKMYMPADIRYSSDEYMCALVCTVHPEHGAGRWRNLECVDHHVKHYDCGVFLRGKLHFLMYGEIILDETSRSEVIIYYGILAFDVHEETFSTMIHRPQGLGDNACEMSLSLFDGNMILMHRDFQMLMIRIWSMNEDASWRHMIDLPVNTEKGLWEFQPCTYTNDGSLLAHDGYRVVSYNIDKKEPTWTTLLSGLNDFSVFPFSWVFKSTSATRGDDDHKGSNDQPNEGKIFSVWSENFVPFEDA
ncbi:F-box protein [Acorus gramineus]|uniref:F-box protein n=1 Tax=Acorus gramineus TaxID=55184 RepID=A0AAV9B2H7_ACOGR|nr:F-box protein [Acorus gramineus]